LSCAKIAGLLYALIGLVVGAVVSLIGIVGGLASNDIAGAAFPAIFGAGAIIILPIFYGCLGFVGTLIMAALYNLLAGAVGGIEVDVQ
jgi:hypothetical protein